MQKPPEPNGLKITHPSAIKRTVWKNNAVTLTDDLAIAVIATAVAPANTGASLQITTHDRARDKANPP